MQPHSTGTALDASHAFEDANPSTAVLNSSTTFQRAHTAGSPQTPSQSHSHARQLDADERAAVLAQEQLVRDVLDKHRQRTPRQVRCVFCYKNGEHPSLYETHTLKDGNGCVQCPILRVLVCPICQATGDKVRACYLLILPSRF